MSAIDTAPRSDAGLQMLGIEPYAKPPSTSYRWRPLEEPASSPRPRGFLARLTSFFIAYHSA